MPFSAYNPTYGGGSYAPSVVPSAYPPPFAGSVAPFSPYGAPMDDEYFGHGGFGHGGSIYGHGGSLYGHGGSLYGHGGYGHGGSLYGHGGYGHGGSYYGHHGYPGRRPYMDPYSDYGYDYDDDYYGDYQDPHYYSSRYRHQYPHYGYGRGYHQYRAMAAYYAPKAYQITGDGGVKTLRYGHEHFKDKLRRYCGLDPRGMRR